MLLFTDTDCNVYASGPFVAVHGSQDGPITLHLHAHGPVVDVLSGEVVGTGPELDAALASGRNARAALRALAHFEAFRTIQIGNKSW